MKNLERYGLRELNPEVLRHIDGGDGGQLSGYYYNQGYNEGMAEVYHNIGDFFRGVYDGLSSIWN